MTVQDVPDMHVVYTPIGEVPNPDGARRVTFEQFGATASTTAARRKTSKPSPAERLSCTLQNVQQQEGCGRYSSGLRLA